MINSSIRHVFSTIKHEFAVYDLLARLAHTPLVVETFSSKRGQIWPWSQTFPVHALEGNGFWSLMLEKEKKRTYMVRPAMQGKVRW